VDHKRYSAFVKHRMCPVCGKEPAGGDAENRMPGENCEYFINLGKKLTKGKYVEIAEEYNDDSILGIYNVKIHEDMPAQRKEINLYRINLQEEKISDNSVPLLHYANNKPSVEKDENDDDTKKNVTFEDMAQKAKGIEALAVLKADVDNMGYMISAGFGERNSISRNAGFSRMLNWFFAVYLPGFLKNSFENVYTLFAGGDDLCLIGPWDQMTDLAKIIQEKFAEFTGKNPGITISAGIELFHPGSPVVKAVENAQKRLNESKDKGKDRVTLFGCTMKWGEEFNLQLDFKRQWEEFIIHTSNEGNISRNNMLYRFLNYRRNYDIEKDIIKKLRHRFMFIYDINRNIKDEKWRMREPFSSLSKTNIDGIPLEETLFFRNIQVGISIAILGQRTKTKKEG